MKALFLSVKIPTPIVRGFIVSAALTLLLVLPIILHGVGAVTTPGATLALVNNGQLTRDASSAIPVVGFGMTSSTGSDKLQSVTVSFSGAGFTAGDDQTLRRLRTDPATSGVAIYRDVGTVDDALDSGDIGVRPSGISWSGSDVVLDFSGVTEPIPTTITGQFQWLIVIRTAAVSGALADGDQIVVRMRAGSIVATSGVGTIVQPVADIVANPLTVRLTRAVDLVPGGRWVGPDRVRVNSTAVLGFTMVDGSISPNHGISDNITQITLRLNDVSGSVTSASLKPLITNSATSGVGLYIDNGAIRGQWDPTDTPVTFASISPIVFPVGGVDLTVTFSAPGLKVPSVNSGAFDFFFVIRTHNILSGDEFTLELRAGSITVKGILGSNPASVDSSLRAPLVDGALASSLVMGDSTPPRLRNLQWFSTSPYILASGLNLYFSHAMTTAQTATAAGQARDDESGLARAAFSLAPSLASSPPAQALTGAGAWRTFAGDYGISSSSLGTSSPVVVTITDQVGNSIDTLTLGSPYAFTFVSSSILVLPSPGWQSGAPSTWVDSNGKLWFSNLLTGTATASLTVSIATLNGFPLNTASFSAAPSLAGSPNPSAFTFTAGTFSTTLSVNYMINSQSTDSSSPITLTVTDTSGTVSAITFPFGLDNQPPVMAITAPPGATSVSGNFVARATVTDSLTGVGSVQFQVDPSGTPVNAFFDGTSYFYPFSSTLFPDGIHRIIVRATDKVGNLNVASADVVFSNGPTNPPSIRVDSPANSERTSGVMTFQVSVVAPIGIKNVTLTVFGQTRPMVLNAMTGLYELRVDTGSIANGAYQATITAVDAAGRTNNSTASFQVANPVPPPQPLLNTTLLFALTLAFLVAAFAVTLYFARKWIGPRLRRTNTASS